MPKGNGVVPVQSCYNSETPVRVADQALAPRGILRGSSGIRPWEEGASCASGKWEPNATTDGCSQWLRISVDFHILSKMFLRRRREEM